MAKEAPYKPDLAKQDMAGYDHQDSYLPRLSLKMDALVRYSTQPDLECQGRMRWNGKSNAGGT
jgi:hypothetical protein